MYMQTFFEITGDSSRINGYGDPSNLLKELSRRPIGQQLLNLLKKTLIHYITCDYPLHSFFLDFDTNCEPCMIHLEKALLA